MPKGRLSPIKIGVPTMPQIPYRWRDRDIHEWMRQIYVEFQIYFEKMKDSLVDSRGFLLVDRQPLGDDFIIIPNANYVDVFDKTPPHTATRTSSAVTALEIGVEGQAIIVTNIGAGDVVIKHGAQTWFVDLEDVTIKQQEALFLRWDSANLIWVQTKTL